MGAWGISTFENDDASDWIYELEETSDLSLLETTFKLSQEKYLESPEGSNILAAAEVLLGLQGKSINELPESVGTWLLKNKSLESAHLNELAVSSIEKVLSDSSELKDLWEEGDDFEQWSALVRSIKEALRD